MSWVDELSRDTRDNMKKKNEISDQVKRYKELTELAQSEIAKKREEAIASKRRIDEKQIRTLRRGFRHAGGFLQPKPPAQETSQPQAPMNEKLGA